MGTLKTIITNPTVIKALMAIAAVVLHVLFGAKFNVETVVSMASAGLVAAGLIPRPGDAPVAVHADDAK